MARPAWRPLEQVLANLEGQTQKGRAFGDQAQAQRRAYAKAVRTLITRTRNASS